MIGYKWVIRVDTDSEFPALVPYNLIDGMVAKKAQYGFRVWSKDHSSVTFALPEAASYWITAEQIRPAWLYEHCRPPNKSGLFSPKHATSTAGHDGWDLGMIYNNFFTANISWWMQPKVQLWLHFLEHTNGYHKFRWGDAPVHTITLGMFMPKNEVLVFGFPYNHQRARMDIGNVSACNGFVHLPEFPRFQHQR